MMSTKADMIKFVKMMVYGITGLFLMFGGLPIMYIGTKVCDCGEYLMTWAEDD